MEQPNDNPGATPESESEIQPSTDELEPAQNRWLDADLLNDSLYSFDGTAFALTTELRAATGNALFRKINDLVEIAPTAAHASEKFKAQTRTEKIVPREIQRLLTEGKIGWRQPKGKDGDYGEVISLVDDLIFNGKPYRKNTKIAQITFKDELVPVDATGALQSAALYSQVSQLTAAVEQLSAICEANFGRIIQGQLDDRLAMVLASRSSFVQALAIRNPARQEQLLLHAIQDANSARAALALQIRSDIAALTADKALKQAEEEKKVRDIDVALFAMNNALEISLCAYSILGEPQAQLSIAKEHQVFLKQVLLKKVKYKGTTLTAWYLIRSKGESVADLKEAQKRERLPSRLVINFTRYLEHNESYLLEWDEQFDE